MANRHLSRVIVMQSLYELDFRPEANILDLVKRNIAAYQEECDVKYIKKNIVGISDHIKEIDVIVSKAAPEWPVEQIAKIDKAILRVAIYELLFSREIPPKVVINEAVEIAKIYGSENSSKFVNGVLGTLYKEDPRYQKESKRDEKMESSEPIQAIPEFNEDEDINLIDLHKGK